MLSPSTHAGANASLKTAQQTNARTTARTAVVLGFRPMVKSRIHDRQRCFRGGTLCVSIVSPILHAFGQAGKCPAVTQILA